MKPFQSLQMLFFLETIICDLAFCFVIREVSQTLFENTIMAYFAKKDWI